MSRPSSENASHLFAHAVEVVRNGSPSLSMIVDPCLSPVVQNGSAFQVQSHRCVKTAIQQTSVSVLDASFGNVTGSPGRVR
jgi:hypothetical protein